MNDNGYLLGYDIGSSSIKASLIDIASQKVVASSTSPQVEMDIISPKPGFAEQHPGTWWKHIKLATAMLRAVKGANLKSVRAIGISYQMHGLVMVDKKGAPLANAIIWCDGRAVDIGARAFAGIGEEKCMSHLLNSPGNFTASKLAWVKENTPDIYKRIHKIMLPGDYIAFKLTGDFTTTPGGLSEGMMWDFKHHRIADFVFDYFGFDYNLIPKIAPCFSVPGGVTRAVAQELGLTEGTPVSYRAGDQPNNALSLNVLEPGEIAATAGTSGVVYGVTDAPASDPAFRVNTFAHVNYSADAPRFGVLLCVNGTGIFNRWVKQNLCSGMTYDDINAEARKAPPGCQGLFDFPYGNGPERTLENRNIGASFCGIDFSSHTRSHMFRAVQEGIVFAMRKGLDVMRETGVVVNRVRAGDANMFKSPLFTEVFAAVSGAEVELYNTDGAQGAARGAGIGSGIYPSAKTAFKNLEVVKRISPDKKLVGIYAEYYSCWNAALNEKWLNSCQSTKARKKRNKILTYHL
ncbi:MAG: FGGY family carbohydrate kinase [Chitinispirillaceae bacterium]|jgi:xylulokinase|nr:FGGY family carbohydrate kinase [Chitinispirillaceae bacterium]